MGIGGRKSPSAGGTLFAEFIPCAYQTHKQANTHQY
jgi:hypothetical protein